MLHRSALIYAGASMPLYWASSDMSEAGKSRTPAFFGLLLIISALLLLLGRLEVIKSTVRGVVRSKIQLFNLFMAAFLAAVNWWINVYSVSINQVVELGIGMFLTPLISVVLGVIFFRETLSRLKWVSVILPTIGVLLMIYMFGRIPWIALGVSSTWALYGVFKKRLGIDPWVSNLLEASLMLPFACAYLYYLWITGQGAFIAAERRSPGF